MAAMGEGTGRYGTTRAKIHPGFASERRFDYPAPARAAERVRWAQVAALGVGGLALLIVCYELADRVLSLGVVPPTIWGLFFGAGLIVLLGGMVTAVIGTNFRDSGDAGETDTLEVPVPESTDATEWLFEDIAPSPSPPPSRPIEPEPMVADPVVHREVPASLPLAAMPIGSDLEPAAARPMTPAPSPAPAPVRAPKFVSKLFRGHSPPPSSKSKPTEPASAKPKKPVAAPAVVAADLASLPGGNVERAGDLLAVVGAQVARDTPASPPTPARKGSKLDSGAELRCAECYRAIPSAVSLDLCPRCNREVCVTCSDMIRRTLDDRPCYHDIAVYA
jgi:hypothetical protein